MKKIDEYGKVDFYDAFRDYWQGILSFDGRSTRAGYWWGQLIFVLGLFAQFVINDAAYQSGYASGYNAFIFIGGVLATALGLFLYIANWAVLFRRLRDLGFKTAPLVGWLILTLIVQLMTYFVPTYLYGKIGFIIMMVIQFIFCCMPSDRLVGPRDNFFVRTSDE